MRKIPTVFDRDWNGDRSHVVDVPHRDCAWVLAGEGVAARKVDGTCCLVRDGVLLKRRELRKGEAAPVGFEVADFDAETGGTIGWTRVGDGPEDRWHREAFDTLADGADGTYELLGPKVQGNPEGRDRHVLVAHADCEIFPDIPRTFEGLRDWMAGRDLEGVVFHHPDGRMAKLKLRDFGLRRPGVR